MSALTIVKRYTARRENKDAAGVLALMTADVVLVVNGKRYVGMNQVHAYLTANYLPAISQEEPTLLADGRVEMNLKVRKFFLTVPVRSIFTLRGVEISQIDVTATLW